MTKPTQWPCLGCGSMLTGRGGKRYCGPDCRPRCSVDECQKPDHARGMCSAHATRAARFGDPLAPKQRHRNEGLCEVDGCDQPMRKTRLCASHYAMKSKYGEIRDWDYRWGEGGYGPTHTLLRRRRGAPGDYECVDCGVPAQEWSYHGGDPDEVVDAEGRRFTRNIDAYSPRCVRCHRIYDENPIAMK